MMATENNNTTVNQLAPEQAKKPYVPPQLIVYGNIEEITRGGAGEEDDGETGTAGQA
jgi:hypothetical protein